MRHLPMIRNLILFCAIPLTVLAQSETRYAATDDGSTLFFVSENRLTGTGQSFRPKIFSWDAARGVRLVYDSPTEFPCCMSITGDGSLIAFQTQSYDEPGRSTGFLLHTSTGKIETVGKAARISRNGRYLYDGERVTDRTTGASRAVALVQYLADDGSVLYRDRTSLHRIAPDGTHQSFEHDALRFGTLETVDAVNVTVPAEILFAGFAPGLIGLYQVDVRVPPYSGNEFISLAGAVNVRMRH